MDNLNSCPICLEPLAAEPFGACVPCGHCLHRSCFGEMVKSNNYGGLSCPMCKQRTQSFCHLFLDLPCETAVVSSSADDSDDFSLDSAQESGAKKDTHDDPIVGRPAVATFVRDVIVLDDDDQKSAPSAATQDQSSSGDLQRYSEYKRTAKKYKALHRFQLRQLSSLHMRLQAKDDEVAQVSLALTKMRDEVDSTLIMLERAEHQRDQCQSKSDAIALTNAQLDRQVHELQDQIAQLKTHKNEAEDRAEKIKRDLERDFKRRQPENTASFNNILKEHRMFQEKNRALEEDMSKLRKTNRQLVTENQALKTVHRRPAPDSAPSLPSAKPAVASQSQSHHIASLHDKIRRNADQASGRALQQWKVVQKSAPTQQRRDDEHRRAFQAGKVSSYSLHLTGHDQKKKRKMDSDGLDLLARDGDGGDNNKDPVITLSAISLLPPSNKRAAPTTTLRRHGSYTSTSSTASRARSK